MTGLAMTQTGNNSPRFHRISSRLSSSWLQLRSVSHLIPGSSSLQSSVSGASSWTCRADVSTEAAFVSAFSLQRSARCLCTSRVSSVSSATTIKTKQSRVERSWKLTTKHKQLKAAKKHLHGLNT